MRPGPIAPDEREAFIHAVGAAFHDTVSPEDVERLRDWHEPGRELAVRDDGLIVATAAIDSLELSVPGATMPAAGVTAVGVRPTHRRRGLARALLHAHLEGLREQPDGEAVAILWATEARIYGRFGFGRAADMGELTVRSDRTALRPELRPEGMTSELHLDVRAALGDLRAVHDAARPHRPGVLARNEAQWRRRLDDRESERDGARPLRALVVRGPEGRPEGYAVYAVKMGSAFDDREVVLREALGSTSRGHRAVWDHLLGLDLTTRISWWLSPTDDEVLWALTNSREAQFKPEDALWLRVVDPARALTARRYAREIDVVLELDDPLLGQNRGRLRLAAAPDGTATSAPTTDPADLSLDIEALGAAFLGGPSLRALGDAGRVQERTRGALDATAAAFRATRAPWCPDIF